LTGLIYESTSSEIANVSTGFTKKNSVKRPHGSGGDGENEGGRMAAALEAFCLTESVHVVRQKEESPEGQFSLTNEAHSDVRQHQDSLLPAARQGEESYETAANCRELPRSGAY